MATTVKLAVTAKELSDVFWLRHEVYVMEEGKFGGSPLKGSRIIDHFDTFPGVANIIAYDGDEPVGTLRVNADKGGGLPSEQYYDFREYKRTVFAHIDAPVFASGSMFAIRKKWQKRRDVVHALLKLAAGVFHHFGTTHILASVNHDTVSIYDRLVLRPIDDQRWIDDVGNYIVPIAGHFSGMYQWAFGDLAVDNFWIKTFSAHFERLLLGPGDVLFHEGDLADRIYIVDNGSLKITRSGPDHDELVLAYLPEGEIVGDLSFLANSHRSATAVSTANTELISLSFETFTTMRRENSQIDEFLMRTLARRMRESVDLMSVIKFAPQTQRVIYALDKLRSIATKDRKDPNVRMIKQGPSDLATSAGVREHEVRRVLEQERAKGVLDYSESTIRFFCERISECDT